MGSRRTKKKSLLVDGNGLFSVDFLKIAALLTMFLDHIGAGILENWILYHYNGDAVLYRKILAADTVLRCVGRMSFPLYCWLLVQGFLYTKNRMKYALRLLIFALVSEVPFDVLFFEGFTMEHQNIFWTLLISLITLILIDYLEHLEKTMVPDGKSIFPVLWKAVLITAAAGTGMLVAHCLKTDYSWKGVLLIAAFYLMRPDRMMQAVWPVTIFLAAYFLEYIWLGWAPSTALNDIFASKWTVYLASLFVWRCNGKKVLRQGKYFFYLFYPLHMLLLIFVRFLLYF